MDRPDTIGRDAVGTQGKQKKHSARWAVTSLALSMLLSSLGISIANVALPTLADAFTASYQAVQWVVLAYLLAITIVIVSVGRLGDSYGHRRVLLAGIGLFTLASMLGGVAPSLWTLIAARAVQGIGAAILMALTVAFVRETVSKERTGSAMGLLGTMSAIGTALGPSLGGVLIAGFGWQAIFLLMAGLGVLAFGLAWRTLPAGERKAGTDRQRFDVAGTLLLGLALGAYALAMTAGRGSFDGRNAALLLAALFAGGLFVAVQARAPSPLIRLAVFRKVQLDASLAMNGLVSTVMMATLIVGPFYLTRGLGLGEALAGMALSVGPVLAALSGVPSGRFVDRLGAPYALTAGLLVMAAGSIALATLPALAGIAGYIAAMALLTPGYALFQAANNTAVMMDVAADQRGVVSGMLSLSRNLGLITGASAMGALFAFTSGSTDMATAHPAAVATGMQATFAAAAVLVAVALGMALASRSLAQRAAQA